MEEGQQGICRGPGTGKKQRRRAENVELVATKYGNAELYHAAMHQALADLT